MNAAQDEVRVLDAVGYTAKVSVPREVIDLVGIQDPGEDSAVQERFPVVGKESVPVDNGGHLLRIGSALQDGRAQGFAEDKIPCQGFVGSQGQLLEGVRERIMPEVVEKGRNQE